MAAGEDELLEYDPPELGRAHMPHGRRPSQEGTPASVAPAGAPATGEFRGAQARVVPGQAVRQLPAVVTLLSDAAEVPVLRRLVGSVHHWHPEVQLLVYLAADLPAEKVSELSSWRGVRVVPVMRVLADLLDDMQLRSLAGERGVLPGLAAGDWPEGGDGPGEAALAAAAGEVDEWYPIVLYHALKAEPAALLLQPWGKSAAFRPDIGKGRVMHYISCEGCSQRPTALDAIAEEAAKDPTTVLHVYIRPRLTTQTTTSKPPSPAEFDCYVSALPTWRPLPSSKPYRLMTCSWRWGKGGGGGGNADVLSRR